MKSIYSFSILVSALLLAVNTSHARQAEGAYGPEADPVTTDTSNSFTIDPDNTTTFYDDSPYTSTTTYTIEPEITADLHTGNFDEVESTPNDIFDTVNADSGGDDSKASDDNHRESNDSNTVDDNSYIPGFGYTEFADTKEQNDHSIAMSVARSEADKVCPSNNCPKIRMHIINQHYFGTLKELESALPQGPLEAMDYFFDNPANDDLETLSFMLELDERVRQGEISAIMPGQFHNAYEKEYPSFNAVQRLGVENVVVITIPGLTGEGISEPYGGYGGTIIMGDRPPSFAYDPLRHESNHAGERAILNIIKDTSVNGPMQGNFDSLSFNDYLELTDASRIIESDFLGRSANAIRCSNCNFIEKLSPEVHEYISNPLEMRAFAAEGKAGVYGYSSLLRNAPGVSRQDSDRVAEQILSSSVLKEQIDIIDRAAQLLLDRGF